MSIDGHDGVIKVEGNDFLESPDWAFAEGTEMSLEKMRVLASNFARYHEWVQAIVFSTDGNGDNFVGIFFNVGTFWSSNATYRGRSVRDEVSRLVSIIDVLAGGRQMRWACVPMSSISHVMEEGNRQPVVLVHKYVAGKSTFGSKPH